MTNLDHLNHLLRNPKLNIPDFRRRVEPNMRNLQWLRKAVRDPEIVALLDLPQRELLGER